MASRLERVGDRSDRHETARVGRSWLSALLDNSSRSVIQLDRHARIVAANRPARGLLEQDEGLSDEDGLLRAATPRDDTELQRLLARAVPSLGAPGSSGSMTITRASARTRLVVNIVPVSTRHLDPRPKRVAVVVLVVDPESRPRIDVELVQAALGLTPAESQLAAMVGAGQRVRDIAASTGRSEGTVRWHLNKIFRKQGIAGQADLVRRVLALDGFPRYRRRRARTGSTPISARPEPDPPGAPDATADQPTEAQRSPLA